VINQTGGDDSENKKNRKRAVHLSGVVNHAGFNYDLEKDVQGDYEIEEKLVSPL